MMKIGHIYLVGAPIEVVTTNYSPRPLQIPTHKDFLGHVSAQILGGNGLCASISLTGFTALCIAKGMGDLIASETEM